MPRTAARGQEGDGVPAIMRFSTRASRSEFRSARRAGFGVDVAQTTSTRPVATADKRLTTSVGPAMSSIQLPMVLLEAAAAAAATKPVK